MSSGHVVYRREIQVSRDFVGKFLIQLPSSKEIEQAREERSHGRSFDSLKNLETMPAARCQSASSVSSCFLPSLVIT